MPTRKPLRIGMIGYGFMGRAHSNAYRRVNNFFDLEYEPVLQAVCARDQAKAREFADKWGYGSTESDWRKLVERYRAAKEKIVAALFWPPVAPRSLGSSAQCSRT